MNDVLQRVEELILAFENTVYDCGEWEDKDAELYRDVLKRATEARELLRQQVRRLVERNGELEEQQEAEIPRLAWEALVAERDQYRKANESVAVCKDHTEIIVDGEDYDNRCAICQIEKWADEAEKLEAERDALLRRLEKIKDAMDGNPEDARRLIWDALALPTPEAQG